MKHLLLTTIAAVVLVGCGESPPPQKSAEVKPAESVAKVPPQQQPNMLGYRHIFLHSMDGDIDGVKALLAAGANVDSRGAFEGTPLNIASEEGHKEVVELLIANGANVNAINDYGRTPLDLAVLNKHAEIANLLRKHGGKIDKVAQEESAKEHDLLLEALSDKIEAARKAEGK